MPPADRAPLRSLHIGLGPLLLVVVTVLAAVVAANVFVAAHRTIGWAVACAVVAVLVEPVIEWLDRYVPRPIAMVVTIAGVFALAVVLWVGAVSDVRDEVEQLRRSAPQAAAELEARSDLARELDLSARVQGVVDTLDDRVASTDEALVSTAGSVPTYLVCGVLTLFFIIYGPRYARGALSRVTDEDRRQRWARIAWTAVRRARHYILFALAEGVVVGALAYGLSRGLGLDGALVLGIIAGIVSMVPIIGIVLGSVPMLLVAAGFESFGTAALVLALFVALQVVDAVVVWRRVDRMTVEVGPAVFVIVALLGFDLYGIGGAVYGVALAVFGVALLDTIATDSVTDGSA